MKQTIFKTIYNPKVNKFLRTINKAIYPILPNNIKIHPSGTLSIKSTEGKVLRIKTNQTNYPMHLVFWEGYKNFEYTDIFIDLIKKVDVFYDIGANIGYYSLLAATENRNIKVVAFEPASGPLFYFKENVRINKFNNIIIEDIALSDKEGEIKFYEIRNKKYKYLKHNLSGESNTGGETTVRNFVPIRVPTTTLNSYIMENGEKNIDLMKMDTEGTEHLILKHSNIVLEQMKPIVICETLFNTIEPELESIFKKHGYKMFNHTEKGLKNVGSIIREEDDGVRNCFFVHPSRLHLIEEFVV